MEQKRLNFNNMIPVDESCTIPLNLRIVGKDVAVKGKDQMIVEYDLQDMNKLM